jgi:hypothetical protein
VGKKGLCNEKPLVYVRLVGNLLIFCLFFFSASVIVKDIIKRTVGKHQTHFTIFSQGWKKQN